MKFIPRKLYAKIEKKLFYRFWENELLNFLKLKLFFFKFKIENFTKTKKTSSYIHPRNIPTDFEKNPNIGCRVTGVDRQTDRQTDRRGCTYWSRLCSFSTIWTWHWITIQLNQLHRFPHITLCTTTRNKYILECKNPCFLLRNTWNI